MVAVRYGGQYDEALERFHRTGPEFEGWLSNHGPMAVEAMARRGRAGDIHSWCDGYVTRLDERPRGIEKIDEEAWRDPLGDPVRTGDWLNFFDRDVRQRPWRETLAIWWPRLLPGIAASATHGVIRVGHAVSALQNAETPLRVAELGQALAYWAARWQPISIPPLRGPLSEPEAWAALPPVRDQRFGIRHRLAQLEETVTWSKAVSALRPPSREEVPQALSTLVATSLEHYATEGHGEPTMLVHACTAPNAVASVVPSLPRDQWEQSYRAVWAATAAVVAAYRPPAPIAPITLPSPEPGDLLDAALATRSEHAIKLVDTALRAHLQHRGSEPLVAGWTAIREQA
jgi:hypothetical protein